MVSDRRSRFQARDRAGSWGAWSAIGSAIGNVFASHAAAARSPVPPGRCVCIAPVATHNVRAPEDRPNRAIPMREEVHGPGSCGSRGHALGASARAKASPGESRLKGRATNAFRRGDRGLTVRRRCIGPALFQITATKDSPLEL